MKLCSRAGSRAHASNCPWSMPAAKKKTAPARKKAAPKRRATRQPSWKQSVPVLERHHWDLIGLALVCLGVFLAFPLYLDFDGGQVGAWIVKACRYGVGEVAFAAPVAFVIAGAIVVLRP